MKYLVRYLNKYKLQGVLAPLFKMIEACFDLAVPLIVAQMIDVGIELGDSRYIIVRFGWLLILAVLGLVCSFTAQYFAAHVAVSASTQLRRRLFGHIGTLSAAQVDRLGSSTLITRMVHDVNQVQGGINMYLRLILRSPLIIIGSAVLAYVLAPDIALVFIGVVVLLFGVIFGVMAIITPLYKKAQRQVDEVTVSTRENIMGVRVVRAFGREQTEQQNFHHINEHLHHTHVKVGKIGAISAPVAHLIIHLATVLILWIGARRVDGGSLLSGDIVALVNYLAHILTEVTKLAHFIVILGKTRASLGRISGVLDTKNTMIYGEITAPAAEEEPETMMSLRDVSLRYHDSDEEALHGISMDIPRGKTVGVIGSTASGKSSLVAVMARFYDATAGGVRLLGHNIREWDKKALHSRVAVVMQRPVLFSGTIRKNLLLGNSHATDEQLWAALDIAQAAEFVRQKEGGLDHIIEEGGLNLSGGQKQRLTIARALVADPDILILDDSASLLDNATEAALRAALREWVNEKRAVVVVSERTASVRYADSIYVLDDGHLAGSGSHETLLHDCAVYREMHHSVHREEAEA